MIDEAYYEDASQTETNTLTGRAGQARQTTTTTCTGLLLMSSAHHDAVQLLVFALNPTPTDDSLTQRNCNVNKGMKFIV
jgi:hypothetical protein